MGRANAMEMLCFGKKINVNEAKERNLVTRIFSQHTFQENVRVKTLTLNQTQQSYLETYFLPYNKNSIQKDIKGNIFCYLQNALEGFLDECNVGSISSIKILVNIGMTQEALHLTNKREIEELKKRLQSTDLLEGETKSVPKKNKSALKKQISCIF